jgi:nitroimidazol reductase NimA-like FMN-containing flavoprotein (pyridoxamine 5'-phosphate oxidase superfamily)
MDGLGEGYWWTMADQDRSPLTDSRRSTLRRKKERGSRDRPMIDAILDEGLVCHVGFTEKGSTFVVPTAYARVGDSVCLHGAPANHMLNALAAGADACLTVTLLDGLVLARSAFHHSMNYRSVMLFGSGSRVDDPAEKLSAVTAILEHLAPGRGADARPPSNSELRATLVVRMPIREGSAKIRSGGPIDDAADAALPVWAGQLPFELTAGPAVSDSGLPDGIDIPEYVSHYPTRRHLPHPG